MEKGIAYRTRGYLTLLAGADLSFHFNWINLEPIAVHQLIQSGNVLSRQHEDNQRRIQAALIIQRFWRLRGIRQHFTRILDAMRTSRNQHISSTMSLASFTSLLSSKKSSSKLNASLRSHHSSIKRPSFSQSDAEIISSQLCDHFNLHQ